MRTLLFALPLASLVLLAGCCGDECYTCPTASPAAVVATKQVATADIPAGSTITEAQWDAMVAADKARSASREVVMAGKVETSREVVVSEKPIQAVPAPVARPASTRMPVIPTEKLPEGWSYMSEVELSDGVLNTVPIEEMYSMTASEANEG